MLLQSTVPFHEWMSASCLPRPCTVISRFLFIHLLVFPHGNAEVFRYMSYGEIEQELNQLAAEHPKLITVTTTQELYHLPSAGTCVRKQGAPEPCKNFVIKITNHSTEPFDPGRLQVLISGALHGDEQVGPMTSFYLIRLLVLKYKTNEWIHRLVNSRILIIMPMTNAIGYATSNRLELGIDPNRDFPYDQDPHLCMRSIAARSINEIHRNNLIQLTLTFHGGMQAIGYNWGSFNYYKGVAHRSPDDNSQKAMASQMSRFAGTGGSSTRNSVYPLRPMSDLVYPVGCSFPCLCNATSC